MKFDLKKAYHSMGFLWDKKSTYQEPEPSASPEPVPDTAKDPVPSNAVQAVSSKTPGGCYARLVLGIIGALIAVYLWDYASRIRSLAALTAAFGHDVSHVSGLITFAVVCFFGSSLAAAITWRHRTGGIISALVMIVSGLFAAGVFANALNQYGLLYAAIGIVLIILAASQRPVSTQQSGGAVETAVETTVETIYVAGPYYHRDAINRLASENLEWQKSGEELVSEGRVMEEIPHYLYRSAPVELVPEPNNQHDKNAIKVMIAGEHVGYISMDENVRIGELLRSGRIRSIRAQISGEWKAALDDGTIVNGSDHVRIILTATII